MPLGCCLLLHRIKFPVKEATFPARHAFLCITCVFSYMHTGFSPWQFMFQHTSLRSATGKTFCLSMSLFPRCMIPPHFFVAAISLLLHFPHFCILLLLQILRLCNFAASTFLLFPYFSASAFLYISFRYFLPHLRLSCYENRNSHRQILPGAVSLLHRIRNR